jgi:multisubunit Na+/H+ antiporter MnhG subunit
MLHVLIWAGVAVQLTCCVGLVVARNAIDRIHFAGAANVLGPALIAAAVAFEEGLFTTNALNAFVVAVLLAMLGGAVSVATARAIRLRDRGTLESTPAERKRGS